MIPRLLYRGDSALSIRHPRDMLQKGYLQTAQSGDPRYLYLRPLFFLLKDHVLRAPAECPFASFSSEYEIAKKCARTESQHTLFPYPDHGWDAIIIALRSDTLIDVKSVGPGIYQASYVGVTPREPGYDPSERIVLVDVVSHVMGVNDFTDEGQETLRRAKQDSEWLIVPLSSPGRKVQRSALRHSSIRAVWMNQRHMRSRLQIIQGRS